MGIENASDHNRRIGRSQREQSAMQQGNDGCLGLDRGHWAPLGPKVTGARE